MVGVGGLAGAVEVALPGVGEQEDVAWHLLIEAIARAKEGVGDFFVGRVRFDELGV